MADPRMPIFTYGSLLDGERMHSRAPAASRGSRAVLKDWRLGGEPNTKSKKVGLKKR